MAKCKACGSGGLFSRVDEVGLCPNCHHSYALMSDSIRILQDSLHLVEDSQYLDTKISRCETALDHIHRILNLPNSVQIWHAFNPTMGLPEIASSIDEVLNDLQTVQVNLAASILDLLRKGPSTQKGLYEVLESAFAKEGRPVDTLSFSVEKSLPNLLKQMEEKEMVSKSKSGRSYIYSIGNKQ